MTIFLAAMQKNYLEYLHISITFFKKTSTKQFFSIDFFSVSAPAFRELARGAERLLPGLQSQHLPAGLRLPHHHGAHGPPVSNQGPAEGHCLQHRGKGLQWDGVRPGVTAY